MTGHIYKKIEVVGTSAKSIEDAIGNAVRKADSSLNNLRWFEVSEVRGAVEGGKVSEWQVGLKIAFTLKQD